MVVDTLEGARAEAGDLIQAVAAGTLDWDRVHSLAGMITAPPRRRDRPVVFKSVGHSLWDLAAAKLAFAEPGQTP